MRFRFGSASFYYDLPESLAPFRLHFQWVYPATGANGLGLQVSQGLRMDFRW